MHLRMLVAIVNTLRYANSDNAVKHERVQLEAAVQVKLTLWRKPERLSLSISESSGLTSCGS